MSDEALNEFYNTLAVQHARSATDGICDILTEELIEEPEVPDDLRSAIETAIWTLYQAYAQNHNVDTSRLCLTATARIVMVVSDAAQKPFGEISERVGSGCAVEVNRAFMNFVEALANHSAEWLAEDLKAQNLTDEQWEQLKKDGLDPRQWRLKRDRDAN